MMGPSRSPTINSGRSGHSGIFGRWTSNKEYTLSSGTESPQQQPVDKKEEKRKSRNFLKKGKRNSTKAF